MSLFQWFSRKPSPTDAGPSSGLAREDEAQAPATRKVERTARRELLYAVVRECMLKASVLSSHYRFKVLSLDKRGRQFLLMIDLDGQLAGGAAQLSQIEASIAQMARQRHDIVVKAVYWRQLGGAAVPTLTTRATEPAKPTPIQVKAKPAFDPLEATEVAAFREALAAASASRPAPLLADLPPARGVPNYTLLTGFEDTELRGDKRGSEQLSTTQPGDLV